MTAQSLFFWGIIEDNMANFFLPSEKGEIKQPNSGASLGNVYASYGIDFDSEPGKIKIAAQVKKAFTDEDDVDFAGYAGAIMSFSDDGSNGKIFAVSDKSFDTNFGTPTTGWAQSSTSGTDPDGGNTVRDAEVFDGLFLVSGDVSSGTQDILSWNGSAWASWWKTTLGQSGLPTGVRTLLKVGADGNLYVGAGANKIFRVTPTGTVSTTGQGTLDFSATYYRFVCIAATSTRLFIGARDLSGDEGVIIEWDMSPQSIAANRIHKIGAQSVACIAVWNDVPIAVLSNGKIKYFNGSSFVDYPNIEFPVKSGARLNDDFMHPNGWAIIDDKPHFLAMGRTATQNTSDSVKETDWVFPAAVWCLDPEIGLYPRFPLGTGETPQEDYGKPAIKDVGALYAYKASRQDQTKFICSYEYYLANGTSVRTALVYYDNTNSQPSRAWLATPFIMSYKEMWKTLDSFYKPMPTGARIKTYSRTENTDPVRVDGNWASSTHFNVVNTGLSIQKGDIALVKMGPGSNQWLKVKEVSESATVTEIIFEDSNTFVSADDAGVLEIFDFRFMGEIKSADYSTLNIPAIGKARKRQILFEFIQPAAQEIEVDQFIVSQ